MRSPARWRRAKFAAAQGRIVKAAHGATPQVRVGKLHNFITLQLYNPEIS
jgi:hypothetical protein